MNQLYSINESVLRYATTYTNHNGQYKIIGVISAEEMKQLHPFMRVIDGWYYELEGFAAVTPRYDVTNHSNESFLRKIHKPSTQSFTEMMSVLKMPNKVWERV